MVARFHAARTLGRPFGHLGLDPSVVTALIEGGSAIATSAIPVIATAVEDGKKGGKKGKKGSKKGKKEDKKSESPASPPPPPPSSSSPSSGPAPFPWGAVLLGLGGVVVAGVLLRSSSKTAVTPLARGGAAQ